MRILVLHPGALGDIILSLPALAALRRRFPESHITIAGNTDCLPCLAWGHADRVVSLSSLPLHRFYSGGGLQGGEAEWWASFDFLISWTGAGNPQFEKTLAGLGKPALVAGWRPEHGEPRHVSRIFADSLDPLVAIRDQVLQARISIPGEGVEEARTWLATRRGQQRKPLVAMHPGASARGKRWPLNRFRSVAWSLEPTHDLLLIEGPAEPGLAVELGRDLRPGGYVVAASLPLGLLAAILYCCDAYLGNDSGISHLAAALGLRSVVIFGPTPPEHWSPSGASVAVLRDATGCAACAGAPGDRHSCLDNITAERARDSLAGHQPA